MERAADRGTSGCRLRSLGSGAAAGGGVAHLRRPFGLCLAALALLALPLLLSWARPALAARIRLQARTQLEVHAEQVQSELRVRGRLFELRGGGVAGASISVQPVDADGGTRPFGAASADGGHVPALPLASVVRTDAGGRFEAVFPRILLPSDRESVQVKIVFAGDPGHARSDAALEVRLGQAAARLELSAEPARLTTDVAGTRLHVRGQVGSLPLAGRLVAIRIDHVEFANATLDEQGEAELDLPTASLVPKGVHTVIAELPPRADVAAASARLSVEVLGALRLSWHLHPTRSGGVPSEAAAARLGAGCGEDTICLEGSAAIADGRGGSIPASGAVITVHAARTRLGSVIASADGAFVVRLRLPVLAELLPPGPVGLVAEAELAEPWISPGWSEVVAIDVPRPVATLELIYGAILALLLVGLGWRLLRAHWRERRAALELAKVDAGLTTTMRAGHGQERLRLRGRVRDGELGRPLPAALTLRGPGERSVQLATEDDGGFDFGELGAGGFRLTVEAEGHAQLEVVLEIPHDGAFDGCQLMPVSLRAVARHALSARVAAASGRGIDWSNETPRSAEPRWLAARRRGHARIRAAVRLAEAAIYGRRVDPAVVQGVQEALKSSDEGEG